MQEKMIHQESTGKYNYGGISGICDGSPSWGKIKDRVAAGDYEPYEVPAPTWNVIRSKRDALLAEQRNIIDREGIKGTTTLTDDQARG